MYSLPLFITTLSVCLYFYISSLGEYYPTNEFSLDTQKGFCLSSLIVSVLKTYFFNECIILKFFAFFFYILINTGEL